VQWSGESEAKMVVEGRTVAVFLWQNDEVASCYFGDYVWIFTHFLVSSAQN
jgi:hypothetical protein